MVETDLLVAARGLIITLKGWPGVSKEWRELEDRAKRNSSSAGNADVEETLDVARWLAEQVVDSDGQVLSTDARSTTESFTALQTHVREISKFDGLSNNSEDYFRLLARNIQQQTASALSKIGTWACQHAARRTNDSTDRMTGLLAEAEEETKKVRERVIEADDAVKEVRDAAEAAKFTAMGNGLATHKEDFLDSVRSAEKSSRWWLAAALVTAVSTMLVAAHFTFGETVGEAVRDADAWLWLRRLPGKIFMLSTLTYATVWCGRRSLVERHNARVNQHRANSIQTVQAFRESVGERAMKDAIVLEAARAIFENVQTGDLGSSSSDASPIAKTIELVRPLGDATKE